MLEPDWEQQRPTPAEVQAMWPPLDLTSEPTPLPAVEEVLAAFRQSHVNGGALFARFTMNLHPVLHWFGSRNRLDEMGFFEQFLRSASVHAALPELQLRENLAAAPDFKWTSAFTLDGEIAQALWFGGPYNRFSGTAREAKDLGARFCDALFGARFEEVLVYWSGRPWAPWFCGIAWDQTWCIIDKRNLHVSLLCATDTD